MPPYLLVRIFPSLREFFLRELLLFFYQNLYIINRMHAYPIETVSLNLKLKRYKICIIVFGILEFNFHWNLSLGILAISLLHFHFDITKHYLRRRYYCSCDFNRKIEYLQRFKAWLINSPEFLFTGFFRRPITRPNNVDWSHGGA